MVGITKPGPSLTTTDDSDRKRDKSYANPLAYFERYPMIRDVLSGAGLPEQESSIVPFPVSQPELYGLYVPMDGTFFLTVYDDWARRRMGMFASVGFKIEVLWE